MNFLGTILKIYLGLLLFATITLAQSSVRRINQSQQDQATQEADVVDYPNNEDESYAAPPPSRRLRPGQLRRRTRPRITTESYLDETITEVPGDLEVTTESEYAKLTKNLKFDCSEQPPGFYANVDTGCRIWHICFGAIRYDNICPVLTLFDQEFVTCVYASDTDCSKAPNFYDKNKLLYITTKPQLKNPSGKPGPRRHRPIQPITTPASSMDYDDFNPSNLPIAKKRL